MEKQPHRDGGTSTMDRKAEASQGGQELSMWQEAGEASVKNIGQKGSVEIGSGAQGGNIYQTKPTKYWDAFTYGANRNTNYISPQRETAIILDSYNKGPEALKPAA